MARDNAVARPSGDALGKAERKRRLRIVLAPSAYYPSVGGIEELTRQLALQLKTDSHDVSILTNRWPPGTSELEELDGIPVTRLQFQLPALRPAAAAHFVGTAPKTAIALVRHLRAVNPDIVHIVGAGPQSVYLASLASSVDSRVVFTAQGELTFDAENVFERSLSLRAGLRHILRRADAVTACSAFVLRHLSRFAPIQARTWVVPNGVSVRDFTRPGPASHDPPYVAAVGRLVPQKGFDVLIRAMSDASLAGLELKIAGDGFERRRLGQLALDLGLASRVAFLGSIGRSKVAELLAGATAFAMPSRGEPFGIALLEAFAAGVPSVASRSGGVSEFARDGTSALLVDQDDPDALAAALTKIQSDSTLRQRLVVGGLKVANDLDWTAIARRYEQLYLQSMTTKRRSKMVR
jgi:glycosyltransferase involved in cell wall biosynthesis